MAESTEDIKEVKPVKYNTYVLMNKPVYFWGFTAYQLVGSFGIIIFVSILAFAIFHAFIGMFIFALLASPIFYFMGIIRRENSRGNPNYLESYNLFRKSPRVITDHENVMLKIYRNQDKKYIKSNSK